jgi:membrane-associated phospholipid phosphatase
MRYETTMSDSIQTATSSLFIHTMAQRNARGRRVSLADALPPDDERPPALVRRLAVFPLLFIPWLVLYESVVNLGPLPHSFEDYLPGEVHWPVLQWMESLYVSPYVLVTLTPFLCRSNRVLRRFMLAGLLATVIGHLTFLTIPAIATPRPFEPRGVLGAMMLWDRKMDLCNGTAAFPSFHVVWAFLGAGVFAARWPRSRDLAWFWAAAVSLSCVFTGMHATVDIVAGFALFLLTWNCQPLFRWLNRLPLFARNGGTESSEIGPPIGRRSDAWAGTKTAAAPS